MKESEWPYAIAHSYEFMGKTHHMRMDEAMAIGRSGRSGTVREYALEPGQYLHRTGATTAAKVSATRVEQSRTVLYAECAGTVAKIVGEVGEYSTASPPGVPPPPAIDLIDDSCLYVKAPMDEVDAPKIQPGQTVRSSFDALPKQAFPGKGKRVAPYVWWV